MDILTINALPSGGAAYAALRLHQALMAHGHSGTFVCTDPVLPGCSPLNYTSPGGAPLLSPLFRYWSSLTTPDSRNVAACELFSDMSTVLLSSAMPEGLIARADIVHLHWAQGVLLSPKLFPQLCGKKIVWTFHDMNPFTGGCHYHVSCRRYEQQCGECPMLVSPGVNDLSAQSHRLRRELYSHLDLALASPSAWLAKLASNSSLFAGQPVAVIPNAHDTKLFSPRDRQALREEYGVPQNVFVVLAGMESLDNPRKNIECVVEAMEIFTETYPEIPFELVMFGGGDVLSASFCIRHVGSVESDTLADWYNMADVFVHPSKLDNLSNTLCEAQCCGTPVIAFDTGGSAEAFQDGVTGFISELSPEALARTINKMFMSDRPRMRVASREFAAHRFCEESVAQQYSRVYEERAGTGGRRQSHGPLEEVLVANVMDSLFKVMVATGAYCEIAVQPSCAQGGKRGGGVEERGAYPEDSRRGCTIRPEASASSGTWIGAMLQKVLSSRKCE